MSSNVTIKLCVWIATAMVMVSIVVLPSCTKQEEERHFRSQSQQESSAIKPVANQGYLFTEYQNNSLILSFIPLREEKVKNVRIYDQAGQLKYINKDPDFSSNQKLEIDCSYYEDGEYLIAVRLDNNQLIEDYFLFD